ncbi:hypothetical protein BZA77DRAFT_295430 [Pyronema omphalodes]|nr:hypothetical protein BZA77DRAFT_295430 [Pyronema omphalodes]
MFSRKRQKRMKVEELMERFSALYKDRENGPHSWHKKKIHKGPTLHFRLAKVNHWLEEQFTGICVDQAHRNLGNKDNGRKRENDDIQSNKNITKRRKNTKDKEERISEREMGGSLGPSSDQDWNPTDEGSDTHKNHGLCVGKGINFASTEKCESSDEIESKGYEADDEKNSEDELFEDQLLQKKLKSDNYKKYPFDPTAYVRKQRLLFRPLEKAAQNSYPSFIECWMAYPNRKPSIKFIVKRYIRVEKAMAEPFDRIDRWIAKRNPVKLNSNYDKTTYEKLKNLRIQIHFLMRESFERSSDAPATDQMVTSIPEDVEAKWNSVLNVINHLKLHALLVLPDESLKS